MVHELTTEDHRAIDRTLALAGHIFDQGEILAQRTPLGGLHLTHAAER